MTVLVDTNVLVDVLDGDTPWTDWAASILARIGARRTLVVSPIVYAEVSVAFETAAEVDDVLASFDREDTPWPAAFLAGKAFVRYRRAGGAKLSPPPDFFIGAHASVNGYAILTRDVARYRTYFPDVELITPQSHP